MPERVERVRLVKISPLVGFAEVRLQGVNLYSLCVVRDGDGTFTFRAPTRSDRFGREWPAYSLQPGVKEEVEAEITRLWRVNG